MSTSLVRRLLPFACLGLAAGLLQGCGDRGRDAAGDGGAARGYSLVLVSLDTVRADHLGAYGGRGVATPNLDALAARGARFLDVTTSAPLTLPSHATLLTGRPPLLHGLRLNGQGRLPADVPTLAERLAAAGYQTAAFVGAFVLDSRFGLDRGFDRYDDDVDRGDQGEAPRLEAERPAGAVVDGALAFLREAPADRPFFLWVHLYDAHAPYAPPPPFAERFARSPYDGEIAYLDHELGRLFARLDERGGRTVVAVVADHGESLGEHGEATHGLLLYQGALAVPWILEAPGVVEPGRRVAAPAGLVDVAPTLAGLLGLPWPACEGAACGRDLADRLREGGAEDPGAENRALYAETEYPATFGWSPLAALRVGPDKLIASPRPELFDLREGESRNRADQDRRRYRELDDQLRALRASARSVTAPLDAEALRQLEALGYAGGGRAGARALGEGAHPLDRLADHARWEALEASLRSDAAAAGAEAGLRALVDGDPGNSVFRTSLARLLRRLGRAADALPLYRRALADAPTDPDAWQNLAAVLREAGSPEAALEAARRALELDPGRPEALNLVGLGELAAGAGDQADARFQAALAADPANATAWNNLGNLRAAQGRLDEAAEAFRRAAELAPRYPDPWSGLGALEVARDRPREAIPLLERALALDPGFEEARLNLGIAHQVAGNREAARRLWRELLERTAGRPQFQAQRQAAQQLLAAF